MLRGGERSRSVAVSSLAQKAYMEGSGPSLRGYISWLLDSLPPWLLGLPFRLFSTDSLDTLVAFICFYNTESERNTP